jgi:four helix bundle protein
MKDQRKVPYDLRERILLFNKDVLGLCKKIPKSPEGEKIRSQLGASASSIGANYEEADGSHSKRDLINKMVIARKEAREARYFLRLIDGVYHQEGAVQAQIDESSEIIRILSSMIKKAKAKENS